MPRNDNLQVRRDSAADWATANPVLRSGEPGFETDTGKLKLGDGTTAWNTLGYISGTGGTATAPSSSYTGGETEGADYGMWTPPSAPQTSDRDVLTLQRTNTFATGMYRWNSPNFDAATDFTSSGWYVFDLRSSASGMSVHSDPRGWINPNTWYDDWYWGATFPAGTSFILPKGTYKWSFLGYLTQDVLPDQVIRTQLEIAQEYANLAEYNLASGDVYFMWRPNDQQLFAYETSFTGYTVAPYDGFHFAPTMYVRGGAQIAGQRPYDIYFNMVKVA